MQISMMQSALVDPLRSRHREPFAICNLLASSLSMSVSMLILKYDVKLTLSVEPYYVRALRARRCHGFREAFEVLYLAAFLGDGKNGQKRLLELCMSLECSRSVG